MMMNGYMVASSFKIMNMLSWPFGLLVFVFVFASWSFAFKIFQADPQLLNNVTSAVTPHSCENLYCFFAHGLFANQNT